MLFIRADIDQSGEFDYDEFRDAVKNYGIKTLTAGSLKTLFDSFDDDGSGTISHEEFIQVFASVPSRRPIRAVAPARISGADLWRDRH